LIDFTKTHYIGEGSWPCGRGTVECDDSGSTHVSGSRFLSTESTCVLTLWRCLTVFHSPHVIPLLACKRTLSFC